MMGLPIIVVFGFAANEGGTPVSVDHRRQLFLDDRLIASMRDVTREIHPAQKHPANPVLWPTEPWEGKVAVIYGSVIEDGGRYRMWYHGGAGVSYAVSDDGIKWTKPLMGLVKVDGKETNTLIRRDAEPGQLNAIPHFYEIFGVHKDPRDPDPSRRYKMGYLSLIRGYKGPRQDIFHRGQRRGLGVAGSADGLHWKVLDSWATEAICDGDTHWLFDPARKKYVLYGRTKFIAPEVKKAWAGNDWVKRFFWGRSVARVESADFVKWNITDPGKAPVVMTVDTKDRPGTEVYSMLVFPYESVYIGLVQTFHNRPDACHLDIQLAVSHDSVHFTRVCDSAGKRVTFIPCGPVGSWDRYNNSLANNPPIAVGDELRFYYGGRTYRHSPYKGKDRGEPGGGIGLATIKRDRFCSLAASFVGGQVVTKPLKPCGKTLHLNAKSDFGQILVEVLDKAGKVAATSKPIRADGVDIPVEWKDGGLGAGDTAVTLRITLRNARLFALWCTE